MTEEEVLATKESIDLARVGIQGLAEDAIKSGMYQDIKTAEQAVMKIIAGRELGLSPLFSLQKLLYVKSQITCMGEVIVYLWQKDGYTWQRIMYNKDGEDIELPTTEDKSLYGCGILLWSPSGKLLTKDVKGGGKPCTFDLGRAAIAGLLTKDNWKNYPDRLLFYRAVAFTARDYSPGLTGGMPTTEEMQDVELQKANVKHISTSGGVATIQQINVEAPMCEKHNVPFTMNKWNAWTHPTDEKNDKGKTIWCYKTKVDEKLVEKSDTMPNPTQKEIKAVSASPQGEPDKVESFREQLKLAMKAAKYSNADLRDHCKRHFGIDDLQAVPLLSPADKAKLLRDLSELADLANA